MRYKATSPSEKCENVRAIIENVSEQLSMLYRALKSCMSTPRQACAL